MNILLLGPQGSGKGTQAELLLEKFHLTHIDMGKILRSVANSDNQYAGIVKEKQEKGELVPDEYVLLIAWDHISKLDPDRRNQGMLFDGYPRSVPQYEHVEDMLARFGKKIDHVIFLNISEEESIRRLSARRNCEQCGRIYNLITNPPPTPDTCECGGKLVQRADDTPDAIKERLRLYHETTLPVLERARQNGVLLEIDGEQSIQAIHEELVNKLS